jgi:hypothetical protein
LRPVDWWKFNDISEVLTASIIREIIALLMEAAGTSETPTDYRAQHSRRHSPSVIELTQLLRFLSVRIK